MAYNKSKFILINHDRTRRGVNFCDMRGRVGGGLRAIVSSHCGNCVLRYYNEFLQWGTKLTAQEEFGVPLILCRTFHKKWSKSFFFSSIRKTWDTRDLQTFVLSAYITVPTLVVPMVLEEDNDIVKSPRVKFRKSQMLVDDHILQIGTNVAFWKIISTGRISFSSLVFTQIFISVFSFV